MAFSFNPSNTSNQPFGSTTKPAFTFGDGGFGSTSTTNTPGFGTATTSTGFSGFGANTSTFGAANTSFGASAPAFGLNQTSGGLFGTTAPAFGSTAPTFGSTAPAFGATAPAFGSTAPAFGSTAPAFGSTAPAFGSTAPAFGSTAPAFGSTAPAFGSTAPAFGATTTTSGLGFGATTNFGSTFGTNFGSNFGKPTGTTAFGLGTSAFGQQQQPMQQQQQQQQNANEALVTAVFNCVVFGDERDHILAKWNLLQAQWGTGTAYYNRNAPPLTLTENNPLCRFKAVGYSRLAESSEHEGLVALTFNKQQSEIKNAESSLIATINSVLGNRQNLQVNIHSITPIADDRTQVEIFIVDTTTSGRIAASELSNALSTDAARNALTCTNVRSLARPPPHVLHKYLETAPPGIDARLWKQAHASNPDPEKYVPVPVVGFSELKWRSKCQAEQTALQAHYLKRARDDLAELRRRRAESSARRVALATRLHDLRHTLLTLVARVAAARPEPLTPAEDEARARLTVVHQQLSAPPLYTGRLNELVSAVRLERSANASACQERYRLDPAAGEELKSFLAQQQKGMHHLLETAKSDLETLEIVATRIHEIRT